MPVSPDYRPLISYQLISLPLFLLHPRNTKNPTKHTQPRTLVVCPAAAATRLSVASPPPTLAWQHLQGPRGPVVQAVCLRLVVVVVGACSVLALVQEEVVVVVSLAVWHTEDRWGRWERRPFQWDCGQVIAGPVVVLWVDACVCVSVGVLGFCVFFYP